MADDQEKTEEATSKKIEDARNKGNVPKSQDLSGFVTLLVGCVALIALMGFMGDRVMNLYLYYQDIIGTPLTRELFFKIVIHSILQSLHILLPLLICVTIAGIISNVMQFGFIFTTEPLMPNFSKLDPIKGLGNLFSLKKAVETAKILIKVSAIFGCAFYVFLQFITELPYTMFYTMFDQLVWLRNKMFILAGIMLLLFMIIAIADVFIVRYQYFKGLRMSKQEVKDEYKQMDGDPRVKGRIRQLQMQAAKKRMMQNIPAADAIITNPTHYAVAIRYDKDKESAPVVLAKGVDHLALRIRQIGIEHGVQIVENPPLARELYRLCDVDDQIPANLFKAVAEVLTFVYLGDKKKFAKRLNG